MWCGVVAVPARSRGPYWAAAFLPGYSYKCTGLGALAACLVTLVMLDLVNWHLLWVLFLSVSTCLVYCTVLSVWCACCSHRCVCCCVYKSGRRFYTTIVFSAANLPAAAGAVFVCARRVTCHLPPYLHRNCVVCYAVLCVASFVPPSCSGIPNFCRIVACAAPPPGVVPSAVALAWFCHLFDRRADRRGDIMA